MPPLIEQRCHCGRKFMVTSTRKKWCPKCLLLPDYERFKIRDGERTPTDEIQIIVENILSSGNILDHCYGLVMKELDRANPNDRPYLLALERLLERYSHATRDNRALTFRVNERAGDPMEGMKPFHKRKINLKALERIFN